LFCFFFLIFKKEKKRKEQGFLFCRCFKFCGILRSRSSDHQSRSIKPTQEALPGEVQ